MPISSIEMGREIDYPCTRSSFKREELNMKRGTFIMVFILFLVVFVPRVQCSEDGQRFILSHETYTFRNITNCEALNTCSLKRIDYLVQDYKVGVVGDYNYGTRFFAKYETDSLETLDDYIFVQFIRGCMYATKVKDNDIFLYYPIARYHFGKAVEFRHNDWVIDTDDADPSYPSNIKRQSRNFWLRWNTTPGSTYYETEKIYGFERPSFPELYAVDRPGQAFFMNRTAKNVSLKFRMCIYKKSDVPRIIEPENTNFATPIHCFEWKSSFIYNHGEERFSSTDEIVAACR
jgi:hypothetical protein